MGNTNIYYCNDNHGMSTVINSCTNVTPNNKQHTSFSTSSSSSASSSASSASYSINTSNTISTILATSSSSSSSGGILTNNLSSTKIKRLVFSGTN